MMKGFEACNELMPVRESVQYCPRCQQEELFESSGDEYFFCAECGHGISMTYCGQCREMQEVEFSEVQGNWICRTCHHADLKFFHEVKEGWCVECQLDQFFLNKDFLYYCHKCGKLFRTKTEQNQKDAAILLNEPEPTSQAANFTGSILPHTSKTRVFFKKLFPGLEDRLFKKILKERYIDTRPKYELYGMISDICIIIKKRYLPLSDELLFDLKTRKVTLEELVHRAVFNVSWDLLACGRYHFYRGYLRPAGKNLKILWNLAVKELQNMGVFSPEEVMIYQKELWADIARVG